jgi:uncharacterized protein (DUF58 family)
MRPTRLAFSIAIVFLLFSILRIFFVIIEPIWFIPGLVLTVIAAIDACICSTRRAPLVERDCPHSVTAGRPVDIVLRFGSGFSPGLFKDPLCVVYDGFPGSFTSSSQPARFRLDRERRKSGFTLKYDVTPDRRGNFTIVPAWVEVSSLLGFWWQRFRLGKSELIRVYPDYRMLTGSLHISETPGSSTETKNLRKRGLGLEFHQLREYQQGDMMRTVDPKASSRFRKLIVREMHEEEDQTVLFLLDTGYRMMASEGGKSHFDRAFEAMLSLAWVALKQGDRVGVRTWGPDERWIPPRRGKSGFPHLVQGLYDIYPSPEASSPATILSQVLPRLARRTLIILLTNFREEDNEDMRRFIPILRSRHLLCTVWMREGVVDELSTRIATTHSDALETMMARHYVEERKRCKRMWEDAGILTIDTVPEQLTGRMIEQYWDIKTKGLL